MTTNGHMRPLGDYQDIESQAKRVIFAWLEWCEAEGWDNEALDAFCTELQRLAQKVNIPLPQGDNDDG